MLKKDNYNILFPSIIVDKQDITNELANDIYIGKDLQVYMSIDDVKNIFDKNLYYEEETGKIITTYGTKVAAIDVNNNDFELNSAKLVLSSGVMKHNIGFYLPISEISNVYNIEIMVNENHVIISSLYKELETVKTLKKISLKEKPGKLLGTVQKVKKDNELIFIENSEKSNWIKVLTYQGNIGYIKEKDVSKKEQKRINMEESDFSSKIIDMENSIEINHKIIKEESVKDFNSRKKVVEEIISKVILKEKYTVNINLNNVSAQEKYLERFIIELIPRLKEIGANLVISNNTILNQEFLNEHNL